MYRQGVCRIRKPAYVGNGCAIFPVFSTEEWAEKIRSQPKTIYSEVPKNHPTQSEHKIFPARAKKACAAGLRHTLFLY